MPRMRPNLMPRTSAAPAIAGRVIRALPAPSPRVRAWLLAGFLAANIALALLPAGDAQRLGWLGPAAWLRELDAEVEVSLANSYSVVVWGAIAVLGLAQLVRPTPAGARRWLRVLGWLSVAVLAALVALEEGLSRKDWVVADMAWIDAATLGHDRVPPNSRWLVLAVPLFAPLLAGAGWVFHTDQRGHPALRLCTLLAAVLLMEAVAQDAFNVLNIPIPAWQQWMEESAQAVGAAALAVILVEMLARPQSAYAAREMPAGERWAVVAVGAALLAASAFSLASHRYLKGDGWDITSPRFYTGPITMVEQPFGVHRDFFSRIDVWAYADGGPPGATAQIFARLTPEGSDRPIRQSRAEVHCTRFSNATATFEFEPIPDSSGKVYRLAVGALPGPVPWVFLGMNSGDTIAEGAALVSGAPTTHADDLALRTAWTGRSIDRVYPQDSRHWGLIGKVMGNIFVWVFLVVATWSGLSGHRPRFWRRFVWPSVGISAVVTACVVGIALALLAVLSPALLV